MRRAALLLVPMAFAACKSGSGPESIGKGYSESFDRAELGTDWKNTGGPYRITNGALVFNNAHNHPLWLQKRLPDDWQIDLDVTGHSPDGDLKVEVMGDGVRFESDEDVRKDAIYTASGYMFIFGGWRNRLSVIAKQNEHTWQFDPSVPRRTDVHVVPGQKYHWTLTKRAGHLEWWIDGQPFLTLDDPQPLQGAGHDRFAFDGWESEAEFDNLKITPL